MTDRLIPPTGGVFMTGTEGDEGLTADGEADVVEYIAEGFTIAEAATAMKISPKTVENHLYSVYQKTGVTNRIQLYNLFENRRRL